MRKITLALLIVLIGGAALAQPGPGKWHDRPDMDRPPGEMIEGFRLFKLTEELQLTEEQTVNVYPLIAEMNRQRDKSHEAIDAKMRELRALLDGDKADMRKAAGLAMDIHKMRGEQAMEHHAAQGKLLGLLSEEQKARFVLFEQMFNRHLREVKERMRERFDGDGPGRPDGPPPMRGERWNR